MVTPPAHLWTLLDITSAEQTKLDGDFPAAKARWATNHDAHGTPFYIRNKLYHS